MVKPGLREWAGRGFGGISGNVGMGGKVQMRIPLTAGQAVTIHGWMNPKETLTWTDVLNNEALTFGFLHGSARIAKELLHRMQPDITAWVSSGRAGIEDLQHLGPWGAHPIRDLKADLGDVIHMRWGAQALSRAGVTYSDLVEAGMTHESMGLLGFTLYDWGLIGFTEADAEKIPAAILGRLFNLTPSGVARCLKK